MISRDRVYAWYRLAVSALTGGSSVFNRDDTYYLEIDTLNKKCIWIATCKAGGEAFKYTIKIDAQANTIIIKDDVGNEILLDSNASNIKLTNANSSIVDLIGSTINITASSSINITAPNIGLNGAVGVSGSSVLNGAPVCVIPELEAGLATKVGILDMEDVLTLKADKTELIAGLEEKADLIHTHVQSDII